jgi:RimJ/RimL family protein N-acetyltransferase
VPTATKVIVHEHVMIPKLIESARLKLRPPEPHDVDAIFEIQSDPEWAKYQLEPPYTRRRAEHAVAYMVLCDWNTQSNWAITLEGEVVGTVNLTFESAGRIGDLGFGLHKRLWGRGFAREAITAVLDRAFAASETLCRVRAHTKPQNERSVSLLRRLGFAHEGTLRANRLQGGNELVDEAVFGLLRQEWLSR